MISFLVQSSARGGHGRSDLWRVAPRSREPAETAMIRATIDGPTPGRRRSMRGRSTLLSLLVLCALAGLGARSSFFGRIGPQPDGTAITPNHWMLTPAGLQVEVGDRPLGMAATPDGRHLLISNNGQGVQSLVLFDTATNKVVQAIPYTAPEALFLGVVVAPDGRRVYASAGGNNKIRVYDFDGRALTERDPIVLGD